MTEPAYEKVLQMMLCDTKMPRPRMLDCTHRQLSDSRPRNPLALPAVGILCLPECMHEGQYPELADAAGQLLPQNGIDAADDS